MKIRMRDGLEFEGTATEIVQGMKSLAFNAEHLSLGAYVDSVAANALKFEGISLDVAGSDDAAKAAALVRAMIDNGLAGDV